MNIVIADDEQIILKWMKKNIEELSPHYHVTGIYSNGKQVLDWSYEGEGGCSVYRYTDAGNGRYGTAESFGRKPAYSLYDYPQRI